MRPSAPGLRSSSKKRGDGRQVARLTALLAVVAINCGASGTPTPAAPEPRNPAIQALDRFGTEQHSRVGDQRSPERHRPTHLQVARVGLEADILAIGLTPDHVLAPPSESQSHRAGWYERSPAPGDIGPAVIVGHVETPSGPAVFADLHRVRAGDRIDVLRADGSTAAFTVTRTMAPDKDEFPSAEVYGDIDHAGLRLITCSGPVDGLGGYHANLIVFARLAPPRS